MKLSYDSALQAYQAAGVTYLRDGGDRWGVCLLAAQLAPEYGIRYAAPGAPLCPTGRYGGFLGRGFAGCDEFRRLVAVNKQSGADFIKLILSGPHGLFLARGFDGAGPAAAGYRRLHRHRP